MFTLRTASEFVEWGAMKSKLLRSVVAMLLASVIAHAQDSRFPPTGQQIPVPECLAVKDLWTGGVKLCSQTEHES